MFDTISVSDNLPFTQEMVDLGITNNDTYQTKDLENVMAHYIIQGGKLYLEKFKIEEWVGGDEKSDTLIGKIGYLDRKEPYLEEVHLHGVLFFYTFISNVQDKWDCWVEFKAYLSYGTVEKYELVTFEKTDNAVIKHRDKEVYAKIERENNLFYNKYFFHTKPIRHLKHKWHKFWYKAGNICHNISHW